MNAIGDLLLAICLGYALGGVWCVLASARAEQRRDELARMEPPTLGALHFNDGHIRHITAPNAEGAIERVLYPQRYVSIGDAVFRREADRG